MATIYNTNPTKKRRRIPSSKDVVWTPEYAVLTNDIYIQNMDSLLASYKAVFRSLVSVSISFDNIRRTLIIAIHAINPKTKTPWIQSLSISENGRSVYIDGGQQEAAWCWKFTYLQKCVRALRSWVREIQENHLSKQRTHERNVQIKEELMRITALPPSAKVKNTLFEGLR